VLIFMRREPCFPTVYYPVRRGRFHSLTVFRSQIRTVPVSYTHLDVYKRQGLVFSRLSKQSRRWPAQRLRPNRKALRYIVRPSLRTTQGLPLRSFEPPSTKPFLRCLRGTLQIGCPRFLQRQDCLPSKACRRSTPPGAARSKFCLLYTSRCV